MKISVDLNEAKEFVTSDSFAGYLVDNTTDLTIAMYILQTLLTKIDEDMEKIEDAN